MQTNISCHRMLTSGVVCALLLLQACGGPKSSSTSGPDGGPVPTSRITLYLTVESSDPDSAVVRANLNDGEVLGATYRLDGGDFLRACLSGVCRSMADNDSVLSPDYIARFDFHPGIDYVVSFNRQEAQDAPDSHVRMPAAFSMVTPASDQQVTDGETVIVSWAPTGAPARVSLSYAADCKFLSGTHSYSSGMLGTDPDADGRESVRIDPILTLARSNATSTLTGCSIDLKVSHELQGRVDSAFHNGTALGIVSRAVNLEYIPR
jgi:hypothetical protein